MIGVTINQAEFDHNYDSSGSFTDWGQWTKTKDPEIEIAIPADGKLSA